MRKIINIIILILFFISSSQVLTQPKWTFHITGGYSIPMQDLKTGVQGNGTDSSLFPYELKRGYNVGADGELALLKDRRLRLVFGLNISRFSNNVSLPNIYSPGQSVVFTSSLNIISVSAGGKYSLLPKKKVSPFVGVDITANFFSGSFSFDNSGDSLAYYPVKLKSSVRLGIQFGAGAEVMFGKEVGGIAGIKYNMANLIGKSYNDPSSLPENEVDISDKAHGSTPARNISYLQIYAGISFYFEISKASKK